MSSRHDLAAELLQTFRRGSSAVLACPQVEGWGKGLLSHCFRDPVCGAWELAALPLRLLRATKGQ